VDLRRSVAQADRKPSMSLKINPGDSHAGDPKMLPSGRGHLVPDPLTQTAEGLGGQQHQPGSQCRLAQKQQPTILAQVAETGKKRPKKACFWNSVAKEGLNSNITTHNPYQAILHPERHQERARLEPNIHLHEAKTSGKNAGGTA